MLVPDHALGLGRAGRRGAALGEQRDELVAQLPLGLEHLAVRLQHLAAQAAHQDGRGLVAVSAWTPGGGGTGSGAPNTAPAGVGARGRPAGGTWAPAGIIVTGSLSNARGWRRRLRGGVGRHRGVPFRGVSAPVPGASGSGAGDRRQPRRPRGPVGGLRRAPAGAPATGAAGRGGHAAGGRGRRRERRRAGALGAGAGAVGAEPRASDERPAPPRPRGAGSERNRGTRHGRPGPGSRGSVATVGAAGRGHQRAGPVRRPQGRPADRASGRGRLSGRGAKALRSTGTPWAARRAASRAMSVAPRAPRRSTETEEVRLVAQGLVDPPRARAARADLDEAAVAVVVRSPDQPGEVDRLAQGDRDVPGHRVRVEVRHRRVVPAAVEDQVPDVDRSGSG